MRGLLLLALLGIHASAVADAEPMPGPAVVVRFYKVGSRKRSSVPLAVWRPEFLKRLDRGVVVRVPA